MSLAVRLWLSLVLLMVGAYGGYSLWRQAHAVRETVEPMVDEHSAPVKPPRPLSDFTFTQRNGKPVNLQGLAGEVWVGSFFFASCPGYCTQMNQILAGMQADLIGRGVKIVSISVDPTVDTPERLTEYAQHFKADENSWLFLTGTLADAQELGQNVFHVTVMGKEHSDRLILVDRRGQVRGTYRSLDPMQLEAFKKKLDEVLAEQPAGQGPA